VIRGAHATTFLLKVSPIVASHRGIYLALVPGHLDKSLLPNFGPNFGLFLAISGLECTKCKK